VTCSLFTAALMAFAKNVNGMYALRFFIGCLEASSYPGIIAILCLWYTPTELVTRLSIFSSSYPGAMMCALRSLGYERFQGSDAVYMFSFTSFMQAALHKNMNGKAGLAGWQWLCVDRSAFSQPNLELMSCSPASLSTLS
jgi:MFS transporter, ACS family, pantothenate transporter